MLKEKINFLIFIPLLLLIPVLVFADSLMAIWSPELYLKRSAQKAIVAWNGEKEIIILSNDIESFQPAIVLRILPLPSEPKIRGTSFEIFERLIGTMNKRLERTEEEMGEEIREKWEEIVFQEKIGAHDLTVVKFEDLDQFLVWIEDFIKEKKLEKKEISQEFKKGIENYLRKGINYFVFDLIETKRGRWSIEPLVYEFDSNFLFYPLIINEITEDSKSIPPIQAFLIVEDTIKSPTHMWREFGVSVELNKKELAQVSEEIASLFDVSAKVRTFLGLRNPEEPGEDLMIFSRFWKRDLYLGYRGEDVKLLQKILMNEGFWPSKTRASGYFGPITKEALIKYQEKRMPSSLQDLGLSQGTGYFGEKTRRFLNSRGLPIKIKKIKWERNLYLEMEGDDVKKLQEILILERVWPRPEVGPTGYFGPITREGVIRFQEKYASEILEPLALEKGTGFVGLLTRNYLRKY